MKHGWGPLPRNPFYYGNLRFPSVVIWRTHAKKRGVFTSGLQGPMVPSTMERKEHRRIGIWLRVSTEEQVAGESPRHHEERARSFAKAKDWRVVEVYRLDAVSGKSVRDHPEAKRMLEDVKRGHVQALVFSKLARLARNTRELLEFSEEFREHGADLISLQESIDTSTPAGRLFFTIVAAMAQWEREEISERIAASVPVRAKLGKPTGGQTVYGYHWVDGELVPHPDEAPVRRLIYELYRKERHKRPVAMILNERGYRTRSGKPFTDMSVERLIRDTTAKGVRLANHTKSQGQNKAWTLKPADEWVRLPVEAIVDEDLWEDCNRILADVKSKYTRVRRKKPTYLFSGLVYCGHCGGTQKLYPQTGWDKYRCTKCACKIAKDDLEELFVEQLGGFLVSEDEVGSYLDTTEDDAKDREVLLEKTRKDLEKAQKREDRLYELYEQEAIGLDEFREKFGPLNEKKQQLVETIANLQEEIRILRSQNVSKEEVIKEGETLLEEWPDLDHDRKRDIIENLVERITVHKDRRVEFSLHFVPGQSLVNSQPNQCEV
ncbi:MAG: recombinase family protein [Akkermansiaceae bacterium]|nr:recombinase family protein [Akkermansiaceae bacterium]